MMQMHFQRWGEPHLAALASLGLFTAAVCALGRRSERIRQNVTTALTVWMVLLAVSIYAEAFRSGMGLGEALPMHLCDWAMIVVILALITRRQLFYELAYFWGLGGSSQALLTPDLPPEIPFIEYLYFFATHGGVITAAFFLTVAWRLRPQRGAVGRAFAATNVYVAAAALLNMLTGANFGYLCEKPLSPSLLDYLGPWPWYIVSLEVVALTLFALLDIPFWLSRRHGYRQNELFQVHPRI